MATKSETAHKQSDAITGLRIEHVSGGVDNSSDGAHPGDTSMEDKPPVNGGDESSDEEEPRLQALSSEQLARRASFKRILDDLSSADQALKSGGSGMDPIAAAAAATLQAQHAAIQAAGLANPSLLPGLLQGMQQNLAAAGATPPATSGGDVQIPAAMMLPSQSLQSALLNAQSLASSQSPLIAGAVQSLASQTNLPATLLSSALLNANMAANLSNATSSAASSPAAGLLNTSATASPAGLKVGGAAGTSPSSQVLDDTTRKREVRLMKNREAARECRRKKKEYVRCLENRVAVLESQNQALIGELRALKELYLPKSNQD